MAPEGRTILHLDMDAFFVAVEVLEDPALAGRPVVVGGTGYRGVVAAASYEARAYGVHSAMPSVRARRLCPDAVFLPGRHELYGHYSRRVHEIMRDVTPLVEGVSLDEAFLDVTGARRLLGDGPEVARLLRSRIRDEVGLSCSVGVAPRKLTAKLASEAAKPTPSTRGPVPGPGVFVVVAEGELAFLHRHPVRALWGVGPATLARLERLGVATVGDLAALPEEAVVAALGDAHGRHLHALAWARDDSSVVPDRPPKSVGHEETFARDHHEHGTLEPELLRMADSVGARLRKHDLAGRTIQLKVRFGDFRTITRSVTLPEAVDTGQEIFTAAKALLSRVDPAPGVRLLGVSAAGLQPGGTRQLTLDVAAAGTDARGPSPGWVDATRAVDDIRRRFGDASIGPAALAGRRSPVKQPGEQQWGPHEEHDG